MLTQCEACPKEAKELKSMEVRGKKLLLCSECYGKEQMNFLMGLVPKANFPEEKELPPTMRTNAIKKEQDRKEEAEEITKQKETPEVNNYLQTIFPVSHPNSVSTTEVSKPEEVAEAKSKKKLTQSELFAQSIQDEQFKIDSLPWKEDPGKAYQMLEERIDLLESIAFEARARAAENTKRRRIEDAKSGKNRWDKKTGGLNPANSSDPRKNPLMKAAKDKHKKSLTKLETLINSYMEMDYSDSEIMESIPEGKFKGSEVREAIQKLRGEFAK